MASRSRALFAATASTRFASACDLDRLPDLSAILIAFARPLGVEGLGGVFFGFFGGFLPGSIFY